MFISISPFHILMLCFLVVRMDEKLLEVVRRALGEFSSFWGFYMEMVDFG